MNASNATQLSGHQTQLHYHSLLKHVLKQHQSSSVFINKIPQEAEHIASNCCQLPGIIPAEVSQDVLDIPMLLYSVNCSVLTGKGAQAPILTLARQVCLR